MCADTSVSTRPEETGLEGEMEKMRSMILAVTLGLATFAAAPAFADERPSFPMSGAAFKQHVDARQAKAREHMEKRAASLPADQAKALREQFNANVAKTNAEVAKAIADGTVTADEAKAVRAASPHGGGKGGHCDKSKKS